VDGFAISQMPTALTADRALMSQHGNRKKKVDCQATGQNMPLPLGSLSHLCTHQNVGQKIGYEMAFPHQTVAACHKFRYIFIILPLTFLLGTHFDDTPLDQMKEF